MWRANSGVVIDFLESNIYSRSFGVPITIVVDNTRCFDLEEITKHVLDYNVDIKLVFDYYPQGNGLAESYNKNMRRIII